MSTTVEESAVEEVMGRIAADMGGALGMLLTALGTRSGLWEALAQKHRPLGGGRRRSVLQPLDEQCVELGGPLQLLEQPLRACPRRVAVVVRAGWPGIRCGATAGAGVARVSGGRRLPGL